MEDHHNEDNKEDIRETVRQMMLTQQDAIYADKDLKLLTYIEKELFRMIAEQYAREDPKMKEHIYTAYTHIMEARAQLKKFTEAKWDAFYEDAVAVFTED